MSGTISAFEAMQIIRIVCKARIRFLEHHEAVLSGKLAYCEDVILRAAIGPIQVEAKEEIAP